MYKEFRIQNFRCFKDFTVKPLSRVNLIAGKNNVGKTALLEAILLHFAYNNPDQSIEVESRRGVHFLELDRFLSNLFFDYIYSNEIKLTCKDNHDEETHLEIKNKDFIKKHGYEKNKETLSSSDMNQSVNKYIPSISVSASASNTDVLKDKSGVRKPLKTTIEFILSSNDRIINRSEIEFSDRTIYYRQTQGKIDAQGFFIGATESISSVFLANTYNELKIINKSSGIIDILRIIAPCINDLTATLHGSNKATIYAMTNQGVGVPIATMGDGIRRLLSISLAIVSSANGVVLIDEIENGLHHSVMQTIWKALFKLSWEYNTQVFATTHSLECIKAAYAAALEDETESNSYDFILHRLEMVQDKRMREAGEPPKLMDIAMDKESMEGIVEFDAEVR